MGDWKMVSLRWEREVEDRSRDNAHAGPDQETSSAFVKTG
jgi:hypothetical protein